MVSSEFDTFMKENKYNYRAYGKDEVAKYLVARSALRGEISELVDEDMSDELVAKIKNKGYIDIRPIYGDFKGLKI